MLSSVSITGSPIRPRRRVSIHFKLRVCAAKRVTLADYDGSPPCALDSEPEPGVCFASVQSATWTPLAAALARHSAWRSLRLALCLPGGPGGSATMALWRAHPPPAGQALPELPVPAASSPAPRARASEKGNESIRVGTMPAGVQKVILATRGAQAARDRPCGLPPLQVDRSH